jgi:hypothetical protein
VAAVQLERGRGLSLRPRPRDPEVLFVDGDAVYDYPCDPHMYVEFLAAPSQGRFVNEVLKPHAERLGRSPTPRPL